LDFFHGVTSDIVYSAVENFSRLTQQNSSSVDVIQTINAGKKTSNELSYCIYDLLIDRMHVEMAG
jgi:hypothetical protein